MALQTPVRETGEARADALVPAPTEPGPARGRPIEDRSFEAVETVAAACCGLAVGAALGGPIGAAVGIVLGGSAGLAAGEALERAVGPAARSTDADPNDR